VLAVHIVGRKSLPERVQLSQLVLQPPQLGDALADLGGLVLQQIQHHPAGGLPPVAQRQNLLDVVQREVQVARAGHQPDPIQIGFNAQYLLDFFAAAAAGPISFEFKDDQSAGQMRPLAEDDYKYRYIVMPMRL